MVCVQVLCFTSASSWRAWCVHSWQCEFPETGQGAWTEDRDVLKHIHTHLNQHQHWLAAALMTSRCSTHLGQAGCVGGFWTELLIFGQMLPTPLLCLDLWPPVPPDTEYRSPALAGQLHPSAWDLHTSVKQMMALNWEHWREEKREIERIMYEATATCYDITKILK